jgi:hypothetical protein
MCIHPSATDMNTQSIIHTLKKSRGKNSFKHGNMYEQRICDKLKTLCYKQLPIDVHSTAGSTPEPDIKTTIQVDGVPVNVCFEIKNGGAFEGGCAKFVPTLGGMKIEKECIHKSILGDAVVYDGHILPWCEGKRTAEDWERVKHIFGRDIYMDAAPDAIAKYYREKGVYYVQIEKLGLYHTGNDILGLGVPMFVCKVAMRSRSSKHKKKGIPTDVTGGLQFERSSLQSSPYDLDSRLPACLTLRTESA